jgi:hypothetical protein
MTTAMQTNPIKIKDVGPIRDLLVDLPDDDGGVMRLLAPNGGGKSTAINAVQALTTGRGVLMRRDHAKKGIMSGFGAEIGVVEKTMRKGEADVPTIESRFDIKTLVDPKIEDPAARERARIKALVGLSGTKADVALFYDLLGGKAAFDRIVDAKDQKTDDLVELAARVQRAINVVAKQTEESKLESDKQSAASELAAHGIDLEQPCDATELQDAVLKITTSVATLKQQRTAYAEAQAAAKLATESLEKYEAGAYSVTLAELNYERDTKNKEQADKVVEELENRLAEAKHELRLATLAMEHSCQLLRSAKQAAETATAWREQIAKAETLPNPSDDELAIAEADAAAARTALDVGASVRMAKAKLVDRDKHLHAAKGYRDLAETLRNAALKVDEVLSKQIPAGPLRCEQGRLVVDTDRCKSEPFNELSDGEKYQLAIPYAVRALDGRGIICLPQECWAALHTPLKDELARLCKSLKVWIITGELADGELRSEIYEPTA